MTEYCCNICSSIEKPLVKQVIEDDKEVWICMKHLFMQILDSGMKEMQKNMTDYVGALYNYKDEFQK